MAYAAKILKDSLSPESVRLTTMEVTFPRIVLAEFNTHRMFSRNSASSRAIPVEKRIAMIKKDPFIPAAFGKNRKGMQSDENLTDEADVLARKTWTLAMKASIRHASALAKIGVHKQLANRLIEPYGWQTVIVTATEWDNFWGLRCHPAAQAEIRTVAEMMKVVYDESTPQILCYGQWHLPLLQPDEFVSDDSEDIGFPVKILSTAVAIKACVGRCARVSYLTQDGIRDINADIALATMLQGNGHMSPFEHVARPMYKDELHVYRTLDPKHYHGDGVISGEVPFLGNFRGWVQARKEVPSEENFLKAQACA